MRIIADAGSSKTNWAIQLSGGDFRIMKTSAINPVIMGDEEVRTRIIDGLIMHLDGEIPSEIFYYGAGCTPLQTERMRGLLMRTTGCGNVHVASDMLGAARSLCGHAPGIACILGTGSNSCLFDGTDIEDSVPALGYIIGDEGSGAALGRRLLSDIFKRRLPASIVERFKSAFGLSMDDVLNRVYRSPEPNRFLASFAPFIKQNIDETCLDRMVTDEFIRFLHRNVSDYPSLPVHFTGSIAVNFTPQLHKAMEICSMMPGHIVADPIQGMIAYHN